METQIKEMKLFTLDPTGKLNDAYFLILVYWGEELTKAQIGDKFGQKAKWACKHIGKIYKILGVQTRQGSIDKAWLTKIFTHKNRK